MTRSTRCLSNRSTSKPLRPSTCMRATWLATRTARLNALRGLCASLGSRIPVGATRVIPAVRAQLTPDGPMPHPAAPRARDAVRGDRRSGSGHTAIERQLAALAEQMPDVDPPADDSGHRTADGERDGRADRRGETISGRPPLRECPRAHRERTLLRPQRGSVGSANAATSTCVSSDQRRALGAVPREAAALDPDRYASWALRTQERRGHNVAAVALANKLARIVWRLDAQRRR